MNKRPSSWHVRELFNYLHFTVDIPDLTRIRIWIWVVTCNPSYILPNIITIYVQSTIDLVAQHYHTWLHLANWLTMWSVPDSYALAGFPTIMIHPTVTRLCHIQMDHHPHSSKRTPLQAHRSRSAISIWVATGGGGGGGSPKERRNGGGGGEWCANEAFYFILSSSQKKIQKDRYIPKSIYFWATDGQGQFKLFFTE
jgi:hypothetical protein